MYRHSNVGASPDSGVIKSEAAAEFAAYDALPPEFRKFLRDAPIPMSALEVYQVCARYGTTPQRRAYLLEECRRRCALLSKADHSLPDMRKPFSKKM